MVYEDFRYIYIYVRIEKNEMNYMITFRIKVDSDIHVH